MFKDNKSKKEPVLDILFVQNYHQQHLGIMQISALLKQHGFTTDVTVGTKEDIINTTIEKNPKVLGFYCTTGFHHKNIDLAAEIKKIRGDEILTIFGGPHPTLVPGMIEAGGVDIICRGEGEYALLELMQSLCADKDYTTIKNLMVKKDGKIYRNETRPLCDVDALPHPDREIYRNIRYIYTNRQQAVMLGRGCPFNCAFCSNHAFRELYKGKGRYVRLRSIPDVIEEFENIKNRYNSPCLYFFDDNFILDKQYCGEFLNAYKKNIGLPFACLIRADSATDELIRLFKEAGCHFVQFGIESGSGNLRNMLLRKNLSDEHILNCAALLHKHKIPFGTFNMVGLPGETLHDVWDTVNINMRAKPRWAKFLVYQVLPGTELAQYSLDKGYVDKIDVAGPDATFFDNSTILRNSAEGRKIIRLKNSANLIIKAPFLKRFVDGIILRLPLDEIYRIMEKLFSVIFFYKASDGMGFCRAFYSILFFVHHRKEFE